MKKQKWTEKPVTWGGYAALCVVCYAISMAIYACYCIAWFEPAWWTSLKKFVQDRFNRTTNTDKE